MKISENGLAVLKYFESCKLTAYPDPGTGGAPWTIGYGHTGPDVHDGLKWTQQQADEALARDLQRFEERVTSLISRPVNQGQFDAMVCLAYNIGYKAFRTSTLLALFNDGKTDQALAQFARWNKSGVRVMRGLIRRRAAESWLFRGATGKEAIKKGQVAA